MHSFFTHAHMCFRMIMNLKRKGLIDMAITVENATRPNRYDHFKVQCRRCGRELSYTRRDVLSHRRWPNGFIYCPACKTPNGHREDNLVESGEIYEEKEAVRKKEEKKKLAEQYTKEELEKEIAKYSVQKVVFLPIGITLMSIGLILVMVFNNLSTQNANPSNPNPQNIYLLFSSLASLVFVGGSVFFVIALVLFSKVKKRKELLRIKENEEKQQQNNQQ